MKKLTALVVLLAAVTAGTFAAGARDSATVEGKLALTGSVPTIVSGKDVYLLPVGPFYQLAWQNGIKVGDTIKVEGYVGTAIGADEAKDSDLPAEAKPVMPSKVWVNGKALSLDNLGFGPRGGTGRGFGGGYCFDGDDDRGYGPGMMGGRGGNGMGRR